MYIYLFLILIILSLLLILILFIFKQILFDITMFFGPFFVAIDDNKLNSMIKLAKPKKKDKIIDLGAGDGKILIKIAKMGFKSEGLEINPLLVNKLDKKVSKLSLDNFINVKRMNFWKCNLSRFDLVFLYGTSYIMKGLEMKLKSELKPGARVVSNHFKFPNWLPEKELNDVYLYRK